MAINVCVIGYGLSAKTFQIPFILTTPGLNLHSILQRTGTTASTDHPTVTIHRSITAVLEDPEIHLAIISSANATHYSFTKSLLLAKKHVLVEKPFTTTSAEAFELVALAKAQNVVLTVFHNRRWDGDFLTLQRLISQRSFGKLVSLESHFDRYKAVVRKEGWRAEGVIGNGVWFDLGAHLVDQVLVLFGLPERVWGSVRDERGGSTEVGKTAGEAGFVDDAFDVVLFYKELVVKLSASITSLCSRQTRFVVRGTEGGWEKYGLDVQEDQSKAGVSPEDPTFGVERVEDWGLMTRADGSAELVKAENGVYKKLFENLVDAIEGRKEVAVKPEEAANVIRILELVQKSEREGRVVDVKKEWEN